MDSTGVGGQHRHARPDAVLEALDWTRVVVGTAARAIVATVVGLALWAAAPAVLGWQPTTVVTGSMAPRLTPGDVVVSRPVPEPDVVPGRVLLADDPDQPGHLRLHRYVEAREDGTLVTKGDANPAADSTPLDRSAVHGVGYLRVPWVGVPVAWAHEGRWGAVAGAAAVLAGLLALCAVDGGLRRAGREARGASAPSVRSGAARSGAGRVHGRRAARGRHGRRSAAAGMSLAVVLAAGLVAVPHGGAEAAPWSRSTATRSNLSALAYARPTLTACSSPLLGTLQLRWTYDGSSAPEPDRFEVVDQNGREVAEVQRPTTGVTRSAPVPTDLLTLRKSSTLTVRASTDTTTAWTSGSTNAWTISTTLGIPSCGSATTVPQGATG
ncbi:S24/S26 family peptidase [Curtobacterium sp. UCD-KPL2560]|uniref:S24/S26 family peptidase n=1 Tax=Curtobacterium sp. UCD-KPL2560 TaxID=1885315 RepID=UPI000824BDC7|nr:S24/S26 family peptidase [Curtobacterium sp. UCD-KPL2560]